MLSACSVENQELIKVPTTVELPTVARVAVVPPILPQDYPTLTPIPSATATATDIPTLVPTNTSVPTATPSSSPTSPPTETPTPSITPASYGLACPAQSPAVPNYKRYWLGEEPWPTPVADPKPHFWMR